MCKLQKGFTLIELMVVVAIISILVAVALPQYQNYITKTAYSELIVGMASPKTAMDNCYAVNRVLSKCDSGSKIGEILPVNTTEKALNTITISPNTAVIIAVPNTYRGIQGVGSATPENCVLTPKVENISIENNILTWTYSGSCVEKGYVNP